MDRLKIPLLLIATALAIFAAWMHPEIVNPFYTDWLFDGQDRSQNAMGLIAYLQQGNWPRLHTPLLSAPEGTSVLFTDSIPLLALLLGPVAWALPQGLQWTGLWLFSCVMLQVFFAWKLVRPYAADATVAWRATVLLALAPMLINRFGHPSLCAQWLILWGLWIYVEPRRAAKPGWWLALIAIAALIHTYLLLMVAAIWGGSLLERFVHGARLRAIAEGLAGSALAIAILWFEGAFDARFASTGTYGAFPLALDAWINPANPAYTFLLPSSANDWGKGFEGLQYLGAGLIGVVILALTTRRGKVRRFAWLVPGYVLIAIVAIGPQALLWGRPLYTINLSPAWLDALDPVRAAGRLFWPATYTLALAAIISVLALPRAMLIIGIALTVQLIDLAPMIKGIRQLNGGPVDRARTHRLHDPRWQQLIAGARQIDFQPAKPYVNPPLLEEVTWSALAANRPVGFTYMARNPLPTEARLAAERAAFERGRIAPGHLVILLDGKAPPALASRVEQIDGVAFIRN